MSTPFIIAQITDCHIGKRGSPFDQQYRSAEHLGNAVNPYFGNDAASRRRCRDRRSYPRGDARGIRTHTRRVGTVCRRRYSWFRVTMTIATIYVLFFPDHAYLPSGPFLQYTVEDLPLRLIFLDTLIAGETGGELCEERIGWLDQRLAEAPTRPTFVCMHHPAVPYRHQAVRSQSRWPRV